MVLMDESFIPPVSLEGVSEAEMLDWKTEYDVLTTLRQMGHHAEPLGVSDDLGVIRHALLERKPDITFNLLEEFHGVGVFAAHVVSYLELMKQPYTGCNPRGLLLAHDKALAKRIFAFHRIQTPKFAVYTQGRRIRSPAKLSYPLLIKSVSEDASLGITSKSLVDNERQLTDRVESIHKELNTDALAEEYIHGREFYVGILGNQRLQTLPIWELVFRNLPSDVPNIATAKVKWDFATQKELGIATQEAADLDASERNKIWKLCKRVYRALSLTGYARMDLRWTDSGEVYVLEANPNPNLSFGEDLAESAEAAGLKYRGLLQKIINLGMRYKGHV